MKLSLFWLLSNLSIYHFRCYSMLFRPLSLILCIATLMPHIFRISTQIFHLLRWFSAPAFQAYSSHSHLYSPYCPHSVLQFPILAFTDSLPSLCFLRIYFMKLVVLVQKRTLPFLLLRISWHQIVYTIYDVIGVITKTYLPYGATSKKSIIC